MSISLYSATVPIFRHYLQRLAETVDIAEQHERRTGRPMLSAALAKGMFAYAQQVNIACGFSVRAVCPLLGIDPPTLAGGDRDWSDLRDRIGATLVFLAQVDAAQIDAAEDLEISTTAGQATRSFKGSDFILQYALPNFFFHVTTAHAILRNQGVPVGKQEFDGYHEYPTGFTF